MINGETDRLLGNGKNEIFPLPGEVGHLLINPALCNQPHRHSKLVSRLALAEIA